MPASKTLATIIPAGTTNSAAGTTTGTPLDLTTKYGAWLTIKITNGASAPTVTAAAYVYTSGDGTNWKLAYTYGGPTGVNAVAEYPYSVSPEIMYLNVVVKDNTGQAVTCEAFAQVLVSI